MDYFKYSRSSIQGLRHLMLSILHQIHTFVNSRLDSSQPSLYASNCVLKSSLQDVHPSSQVAISLPAFVFCHLAIILAIQWRCWCLIIRAGGQLRLTNFSTLSSTMVFKSGKSHALTSRQSVNRLDNLSCVYIREWVYIFRVTYVFWWWWHLST